MEIQTLLKPEVQAFINEHEQDDPAQLMLQSARYPGMPMAEVVQQISSRQKARKKLPEWYATPGLIFPPSLSMEQCSSEATARFKAGLVSGSSGADITGGFGVDCYYLSHRFGSMQYVEQNPELAQLASHNFKQLNAATIQVHAQQATTFLAQQTEKLSCLFLDPARRNEHKGKVYRLEDCEPNVLQLLPLLLSKVEKVLLKTAPLLDLDLAISSLAKVEQVWVVGYAGECREVLYLISEKGTPEPKITAVDLKDTEDPKLLSFTRLQEAEQQVNFSDPMRYLYEPNAAIMKAGAFKTTASAFHLNKLHPSSHLYTSDSLVPDFPGRVFRVEQLVKYSRKEVQAAVPAGKANISARNFPDAVAAVRKKTGLKEGGDAYIFATTLKEGKPVLILCSKI